MQLKDILVRGLALVSSSSSSSSEKDGPHPSKKVIYGSCLDKRQSSSNNSSSSNSGDDITGGGQIIYSLPETGDAYSGIPSFGWIPVNGTFTANSSTVTFSILVRNDPSFFAFDDFSITPVLPNTSMPTSLNITSPLNIIHNPSFETGFASPWSYVGVTGLPFAGKVADNTTSTITAHSGDWDFYDGAVGGIDGISQALQTIPGTTYFASFYIAALDTVAPGEPALVQAVVSGFGPPTNIHLTPATHSGADSTGGITNVADPVVVGNASPRIGVDVSLNGSYIGTTNSSQNGTFTFPLTNNPLPPGLTTVTTITVVGNDTSSPSVPFFINYIPDLSDSANSSSSSSSSSPTSNPTSISSSTSYPPTISLCQAASPNIPVNANDTFHLTGMATPNTNITIADNGMVLGSVVVESNGTYVFGTQVVGGPGTHNFTAKEEDGSGSPGLGVVVLEPACV